MTLLLQKIRHLTQSTPDWGIQKDNVGESGIPLKPTNDPDYNV